jgi:hypothetical protein
MIVFVRTYMLHIYILSDVLETLVAHAHALNYCKQIKWDVPSGKLTAEAKLHLSDIYGMCA